MSQVFLRALAENVLTLLPPALAWLIGALVTLAYRRRLGDAAYWAITGFAVLSLGAVGEIIFWIHLLNEQYGLPNFRGEQPTGLRVAFDLAPTVDLAVNLTSIVGLLLLAGAVFVDRRRHVQEVAA